MTISSSLVRREEGDHAQAALPTPIPLSMALARQPLRLVEIRAGRELTHRLTELGLTPGVVLSIVQDAGGPLLISVRGSRIAIGRGLAHKLLVTVN
jgi:ferrous iron transport protein A